MAHPILDSSNNILGDFNPKSEYRILKEESQISINVNDLDINNKYFLKLIENNKAFVSIKLLCGSTLMSWSQRIEESKEISLSMNKIHDIIEIQFFIIASKDIEFYDESFNEIYKGVKFQVNRNDIIGRSGSSKIHIYELYESEKARGLFDILPYNDKNISYRYNGDQIKILYPDQSSNNIVKIHNQLFNLSISNFFLTFLYPCILHVIHSIKKEEISEYENKLWFIKIEEIVGEKIEDLDTVEFSWKFINKVRKNTLASSFNELKRG
tara:strand:+ start:109 stop:912 length:804 start_codon:yes stop_codon:yes gene_type:complete